MSEDKKLNDNYFEFRKKFTNQFQVLQITLLVKEWGLESTQDVCYKLIVDGINREKLRRENTSTPTVPRS